MPSSTDALAADASQEMRGAPFDPPVEGRLGFGARFVTALSVGSVLNPINSSIIAIALVAIGSAFQARADATAWLVSALYLTTAVAQPTMGRLADEVGARNVYLCGLLLVALGGLAGFLAPNLSALVASRIVIGLGTSAAYPAAIAMVRRQAERLSRPTPGSVLSALAMAGQISMAVGPLLGGLLMALGGWRWTFAVNIPVAALGAGMAMAWLPKDDRRATRFGKVWRAIDPLGIMLFASALIVLLIFLSALTRPNGPLAGLAFGLGAGFLIWEWRRTAPFIDVRMLVHRSGLSGTYARSLLAFLVVYFFLFGWTQWLEQSRGFSPALSGLLMAPSFAVATLVSLTGSRPRQIRGTLVMAAAALCLVSAWLMALGPQTPIWALGLFSCLFGVPIGLSIIGNQAAMYVQSTADRIGVASGLLRTFNYLGAILSSSLTGFAFGPRASDPGLHLAGGVCLAASLLLFAMTLASRSLRVAADPAAPPNTR